VRIPEIMRRVLGLVMLSLCLVLGGSTAALAEPTAEQEDAARQAAAEAGAAKICDTMLGVLADRGAEACRSVITPALKAADWSNLDGAAICQSMMTGAVGPGLAQPTCEKIIGPGLANAGLVMQKTYEDTIAAATAGGAAGTGGTAAGASTGSFIANPEGEFERIVNLVRDSAVEFYKKVIDELLKVGEPDFGAQWWIQSYAAATGIAVILAAFMTLFLFKDASADKISPQQLKQGLQYLVYAFIAMFFAPVIVRLINQLTHGLSQGIILWGGESSLDGIVNAAILTAQVSAIPGGVIIGLLVFLGLLAGAFMIFLTLLMQGLAVYMVSIAMGIGFGMLIHPRWRAKALRIPLLVVGLLFARPLIFFLLMVIGKMVADYDPWQDLTDPFKLLGEALLIMLALLFVGFAPWTLMKYFPILPDGSEQVGGDFNPLDTLAGAGAGALSMKMGMDRMQQMSSGGGGGSSGGRSSSGGWSSGGQRSAGTGTSGSGSGGSGSASAGAGPARSPIGAGARGAGAAGAGGAGKAGATAAAGVGSAGVLLAAAAAMKGGQMAASGVKQVAQSAAPHAAGSADESSSDINDGREWR